MQQGSYVHAFRFLLILFVAFLAGCKPVAKNQDLTATVDTPVAIVLEASNSPTSFNITIPPTHGTLTGDLPEVVFTPDTGFVGVDQFQFTATNNDGVSAPATVIITITSEQTDPVTINNFNAEPSIIAEGQSATLTWAVLNADSVDIAPSIGSVSATGSQIVSPITTTTYTLSASQGSETVSEQLTITVNNLPDDIPEDPSNIAPPIESSTTDFSDQVSFLYEGSDPVQRDADPAVFAEPQMAVVRGKVLDTAGDPLPGVKITVLNHPEYGYTKSRADGLFDMVVNGGSLHTIQYEKSGYPSAQRTVDIKWQDYQLVDDVVLVEYDSKSTLVTMGDSEFQVARSSVSTDSDGSRTTTVLIPPATQALLVMPDGSTTSADKLTIRATEYTVGEDGPRRMPGVLPPTSGYTFAVELSADEAIAAGAKSIQFNKPVPFYVTNFLQFPTGVIVPTGWYDADKAAWIPSDNGLVIEVLAIENDRAVLDVTGTGQPATTEELNALGVTSEELTTLAATYAVGDSLWRVPVTHFTPWDCNWPVVPPQDAKTHDKAPEDNKPKKDPCKESGSIIECENQILGESIPIAGTNVSLNYRSDRVPGHIANRTLKINLLGDSIPASLQGIELSVEVAGKIFTKSFLPQANLTHSYTWDGKDAFNRVVLGPRLAKVRIGYTYPAEYKATPFDFDQAWRGFAQPGVFIAGNRQNDTITLWREWESDLTSLFNLDAKELFGLGGWSINAHHRYNARSNTVYLGNGEKLQVRSVTDVSVIAGTGSDIGCKDQDSGPATQTNLCGAMGMAVGSDNTIYFLESDDDPAGFRIREISTSGMLTTLATGASEAVGIDIDSDDNLYVAADTHVLRVSRSGAIETIVGGGAMSAPYIDGTPATSLNLAGISSVKVASDGTLYFLSFTQGYVGKITPDGLFHMVAGCRSGVGCGGDGGPANQAIVNSPLGLDIGSDGSIYFAELATGVSGHRIRKVTPDGIIRTIAGGGFDFLNDNIPATSAGLISPAGVFVDDDGSVYFSSFGRGIAKVSPQGILSTVIQFRKITPVDEPGTTRDIVIYALAITKDKHGNMLLSDTSNYSIIGLSNTFIDVDSAQYSIVSEDGAEIYTFDIAGRHVVTHRAVNNELLLRFEYEDGLLKTITDAEDNVTEIIRYGSTGFDIKAPFNQITQVRFDANGYIHSVTNPASEIYRAMHDAGGLLRGFELPNGLASILDYDPLGRLSLDENSLGNSWTLDRAELENGYEVLKTSKLGRYTTYTIENLSIGGFKRIVTHPDGARDIRTLKGDGSFVYIFADGTKITGSDSPDPRFGMQSPYIGSKTTELPSGKKRVEIKERFIVPVQWNNLSDLQEVNETTTINGKLWTSSYEVSTNTYTLITPESRTQQIVFDNMGRIKEKRIPGLDTIFYHYDSRGRLEDISQGTGSDKRSTTYAYRSSDGYLDSIAYEDGSWVSFTEYDSVGRSHKQTFDDGRTIDYDFDVMGNVTGVTPPGKPLHELSYTKTGFEEFYIAPALGSLNRTTHRIFDLDKNIDLVTRPDNTSIDYIYDPDTGQLDQITWNGLQFDFGYDAVTGQLKTANSPYGVNLEFGYDGSFLARETWSGEVAGTVNHHYNNLFQLESEDINGSHAITFQYDDDGLLEQVGNLVFTLDPDNGLLKRTTLTNVVTDLGFSTLGEVNSYSARYNMTSLYSFNVTNRDNKGRITDITEIMEGATINKHFDYDTADRLWKVYHNGALVREYGYDLNGNRTHLNGILIGSYDNRDRLNTYDGVIYGYTANGELETKTQGPQITRYTYDAFNNLTKVELPGGTVIDYVVDSAGRRVGKKVNGIQVQGFLYADALNPIAELDGDNSVVARFVYGSKAYVPDYMLKNGQTYRIVSDWVGTVRLVVNVNDGAVAQRIDYDEFGRVLSDTNPGFQPFGFAGGIYDGDAKLVRFGVRDYDSFVGRWTTKDPIRFAAGDSNIYAYVGGDPVTFVDPKGKIKEIILVGGACLALYCAVKAADSCAADDTVNGDSSEKLQCLSNRVGVCVAGAGGLIDPLGEAVIQTGGSVGEAVSDFNK